ncbi:hypothetical protein [Geomonas diazotrophica]|uniref:Uncharacterized protein n=1 Tax=Geomonas diazotrophica TaxID=2843197 RepID=A0ABX8JFU1_9BACT|nr:MULTISPECIES: hypothetical protein [Geomonas]QWV97188.1 hypothetical protein KP005_17875 [Geomonas nitrogeniifigens]QXE86360.1 hypothetical protein KP003_18690 [Geomonas nitrogeniifigens]
MRITMNDYVGSSCEAVSDSQRFVYLWFRTGGNPCLQCGVKPETCDWHRHLSRTTRRFDEARA